MAQYTVWSLGSFLMFRSLAKILAMIPFGGKVRFKVYNPDKPDKYGVKSKQNNGALQAVEFKDCRVFQILSPIHSVTDVELG